MFRYRPFACLSAAAVLIIAPPGVPAQEDPPVESVTVIGQRALRQTVETGSRLGLDALSLPAAVDVIDQAELRRRGLNDSGEALLAATGFTASPRPGASISLQARGFSENSFGVLYDGIRVGSTTPTMRTYDTFAFERVEVLRGVSGLTHGEGSIGGAVNYIRKRPRREAQPLEVLASAGSSNARRFGVGGGGAVGDRWAVRADAAFQQVDGDARGNRNEYQHLVASAGGELTATLRTQLSLDWLRNDIDDPYWGTPLVEGRLDERLRSINYNNLPDNKHEDEVRWLTWRTDADVGRFGLHNTAWHYQADRDWRNAYRFQHVPAAGDEPERVTRGWFEDLGYDHAFYGNRIELRDSNGIANGGFRWSVGVEYAATDFRSPRGAAFGAPETVDALDPFPTSFFEQNPAGRNRELQVDQTQLSAFVEGQWQITSSLSVVGGLRHDRLDFDYTDVRPDETRQFGRAFSPTTGRIGLVLAFNRERSAYLQYATGRESRWAGFFLGPEDLLFDLSRGRQVEAGWKQVLPDSLGEWSLAIYEIVKDRIPFTDTESGETIAAGKQSARGAELAAHLQPHAVLEIEANAAWLRPRFERFHGGGQRFDGNVPPNVPRRVANLGLTAQLDPRLTLGIWGRYAGSFHADNANSVRLPSAVTVDAYARFAASDSLALSLRGRNLTDRFYATWATDANYVIVAPGRAVELVLEARL